MRARQVTFYLSMRLKDRVAIVTGAGREGGIGEAIALRLASEGAHVVIVDICQQGVTGWNEAFGQWEELLSISERVSNLGQRCIPIKANLLSEDDVKAVISKTIAEFGQIDVLCNNAAGGRGAGPIEVVNVVDIELENWRYTIDVNLTTTFLCAKHAARAMMISGRGGSIINTSSIAARRAVPGGAGYAVAKLGVIGLTTTLSAELAPYNIRVNAVAPGVTDTPWVRQRVQHMSHRTGRAADKLLSQWTKSIPLKYPATPQQQASVIAFLASDDASYITGQTIGVDGGLSLG